MGATASYVSATVHHPPQAQALPSGSSVPLNAQLRVWIPRYSAEPEQPTIVLRADGGGEQSFDLKAATPTEQWHLLVVQPKLLPNTVYQIRIHGNDGHRRVLSRFQTSTMTDTEPPVWTGVREARLDLGRRFTHVVIGHDEIQDNLSQTVLAVWFADRVESLDYTSAPLAFVVPGTTQTILGDDGAISGRASPLALPRNQRFALGIVAVDAAGNMGVKSQITLGGERSARDGVAFCNTRKCMSPGEILLWSLLPLLLCWLGSHRAVQVLATRAKALRGFQLTYGANDEDTSIDDDARVEAWQAVAHRDITLCAAQGKALITMGLTLAVLVLDAGLLLWNRDLLGGVPGRDFAAPALLAFAGVRIAVVLLLRKRVRALAAQAQQAPCAGRASLQDTLERWRRAARVQPPLPRAIVRR